MSTVLRLICFGGPQDGWEFALTREQLPMRLDRCRGAYRLGPHPTTDHAVLRWTQDPPPPPRP